MTKDTKGLIDNTINHVTIYDTAFSSESVYTSKLSKCCGRGVGVNKGSLFTTV